MGAIKDKIHSDSDDSEGGREVVTDQAQARIERAEIEARQRALKKYADERREEAEQEELDRLRTEGTGDSPGFLTQLLRGFVETLKAFDKQMVESHGNDSDSEGQNVEILDSSRQPQMPDALGQRDDEGDDRSGP